MITASPKNRRVTVIVLGGTITMVAKQGGGLSPSIDGDDLVAAIPQVADVAEINVITPFLIPGASITFTQVAEVSDLISQAASSGVDGVVVVQGTDTIDEVSFLLDLAVGRMPNAPAIVVTGAMRGADAPGADGQANLLAAIIVAASPDARGQGVLVVLNDEVHSAQFVQKMDTGQPSSFCSPGFGPVGTVTEGRLRLRLFPQRPQRASLPLKTAVPIAVVQTGLGDNGGLLATIADAGFEGAIIAAMGAGHVPQSILQELDTLVSKMPVILATRVPGGPVFTQSYGFDGSEIDLIRRGLIPAGFLPPHKARLLLACLLGAGVTAEDLKFQFQDFN